MGASVVIVPHVFVEDMTVASIAKVRIVYEATEFRARLARYHADVDSAFYGWNDIWLDPAVRSWNIVGTLATIARPLLAIQTEDDHYATMAQVETIAIAVEGARLVKLPSGGHSPHQEVAAALNDVIADFVTGVGAMQDSR